MKDPKLCSTPYCKNKKAKWRSTCNKCKTRFYRKKNPVKSAYYILMQNAKHRGIVFTISFEYFQQFAHEFNYIAGKANTKTGLTVDRIDNSLGYVPGNLQILTRSENASKGTKILVYDYRTHYATVI